MINFGKRNRIPIVLAIILMVSVGTATAFAASPETADSKKADWKFHDIVEVDFVKQYVKIPKPEGVMIIDSRPARTRYDKGHIPTAVNIPDSKFEKMTHLLPKDKETLLIFYCQGLK